MSSEHAAHASSFLSKPLPEIPIPALHQQHLHFQRQQLQNSQQAQQQQHTDQRVSSYRINEQEQNRDLMEPVRGLIRVRRAIDLAAHGTIAFLSVYAFGSIISTLQFQSSRGYTSMTALFMFLVSGVSFVVAAMYMGLAVWARTSNGMDRIRIYLQQRSQPNEDAPEKTSSLPSWTLRAAVLLVSNRPRLWIQAGLVVTCLLAATMQWFKTRNASDCGAVPVAYRHFCSTTKAAVITTFLTAFFWVVCLGGWYYKSKVSRAAGATVGAIEEVQRGDVVIPMPDERRSMDMREPYSGISRGIMGSSAAIGQVHSQSQPQLQPQPELQPQSQPQLQPQSQQGTPKHQQGTPEHQQGTPKHEQSTPKHEQSTPSHEQSTPEHQQSTPKHEQCTPEHQQGTPKHEQGSLKHQQVDPLEVNVPSWEKHQNRAGPFIAPLDLGLGIDICTKSFMDVSDLHFTETENEDACHNSNIAINSIIGNSVSCNNLISEDADHVSETNLNRNHPHSISLSGLNNLNHAISTGGHPLRGRSRSNSACSLSNQSINSNNVNGRFRDHAKIFPMPRGSNGSIQEAYSCRNTPILGSRSRDFGLRSAVSLNRLSSSGAFSPNVSTPTTPLSRGEMGYMGVGTIKALANNVPRSVSMGHIAAFNNMNANSTNTMSSSVAGSAAPSAQCSPVIGAFDPVGTPGSLKSHQSMSSFFGPGAYGGSYPQSHAEAEAAEQSMDDHLRSIRRRSFVTGVDPLEMVPEDPVSLTDAMFAAGSPISATPSRGGSFRMSFSSPNLNSYRRRSSLGLKSVLNSIVSSPMESDTSSISSSSSEMSSPRSISSPREGGSGSCTPGDASSFEEHKKLEQTVSAQELLHAEYGDLYPNLSKSNSEMHSNGLKPYSTPNLMVPGTGRPRSASVSSDSTTHTSSSKSSDSNSSKSSDSNSSTSSSLTTLSNEKKRSVKVTRPPSAFLNRILIGNHRADVNEAPHHQKKRPQHQNSTVKMDSAREDPAEMSMRMPLPC